MLNVSLGMDAFVKWLFCVVWEMLFFCVKCMDCVLVGSDLGRTRDC